MKKEIKITSIIVLIIILIIISYYMGYKCSYIKFKNKEENAQINEEKEINKIKAVSTFMIKNVNNIEDNSVTSEKLYNVDLSDTFEEVINSNSINQKLYPKYGNDNNLKVVSINEYNTMYNVIFESSNYDRNKCIEITNEYIKEFQKLIPQIYNCEIVIVDSAHISNENI